MNHITLIKDKENDNLDIQSFLESLQDNGKDYDFLLLHCYCHIKNAEIYFSIDKDIYLHCVIYEGLNFLDAVKQYSFTLQKGAILVYKRKEYPFVSLEDFTDCHEDFLTFEKEISSLSNKAKKPLFSLLFDGDKAKLL